MASEQEISHPYRVHDISEDGDDQDTDEELEEEEEEGEEEEVDDRRKSKYGIFCTPRSKQFSLGQVLDPRAKWVQEWNRVFLLVCATGLFVDPLFFYALSISKTCLCLFVDGWFALTVTVLRCMTDALHVWNMWLQLKMAKSSYTIRYGSNSQQGNSRFHYNMSSRAVAVRYFKAKKGFFFDLFVILPLPQVVLWVVIPSLLERGETTIVMTVFLIMFLFQYLPKIYHSVCLLRRMQNLSGYIFGTVWWGIALNLIAYFVASHIHLQTYTYRQDYVLIL